jgi:hypothetical protein
MDKPPLLDPTSLRVVSNAPGAGSIDWWPAALSAFRPALQAFAEAQQLGPRPTQAGNTDRPTAEIRKGPWNERRDRPDAGQSPATDPDRPEK